MNELISLKNVSKSYNGNFNVLKSINICIEVNSITSIIGKSGCGKTTLLNIIGGLDLPTNGQVIVNGVNITDLPEHSLNKFRSKNIGFVFQFFNLIPELTVKENILFPAAIQKRKIEKDWIDYLIKITGLDKHLTKIPAQLSGGEQQRVAIIRALVGHPIIVLMDEPTGNLDEENTHIVCGLIKKMKNELNQTIMLVTHDNDVSKIADQVINMRDGKIGDCKK